MIFVVIVIFTESLNIHKLTFPNVHYICDVIQFPGKMFTYWSVHRVGINFKGQASISRVDFDFEAAASFRKDENANCLAGS
jgi:hypothetical protein